MFILIYNSSYSFKLLSHREIKKTNVLIFIKHAKNNKNIFCRKAFINVHLQRI